MSLPRKAAEHSCDKCQSPPGRRPDSRRARARPGPGHAGRPRGPRSSAGALPTTPYPAQEDLQAIPASGSPPAPETWQTRAAEAAGSGSSRSRPGRVGALDRLAGLAKQAGDEADAARLRGRKAELDQIVERRRERLFKPDDGGPRPRS